MKLIKGLSIGDPALNWGRKKTNYYVNYNKDGVSDLDLLTVFHHYHKVNRTYYTVLFNGQIVSCERKKADAEKTLRMLQLPYLTSRQDLHPIELGLAFNILLDKGAFNSQSSLADTLSMSESTISEYIKYTKIPEEIRHILIKRGIKSRDKLRKILLENGDIQKIKQILGLVEAKKETKSFSVMRINILNDKFKFQLNGIEKLKIEQKEILKKQLVIVINKL